MRYLSYAWSLILVFALTACGESATSEAADQDQPEATEESANTGEDEAEAEPLSATAFAEANPTVTTQEITYATDETEMKGYLAYNGEVDGKRPGVLVIHEWWGHNDYARKRAEMLADLGYVALAVDMYGEGQQADHPEDAGKFASAVFSNMDEAKARFAQALSVLKAHPMVDGDKMAAIGYCFGGSVALSMANAGYDLDAVAAFHSGVALPIMPDAETSTKAAVLVANGADDPFISLESVVAWTKAMDEAEIPHEYVSYDDTKHAFTDPGATAKGIEFDLPLAYNEASDRDAWKKLQELLNSAFK